MNSIKKKLRGHPIQTTAVSIPAKPTEDDNAEILNLKGKQRQYSLNLQRFEENTQFCQCQTSVSLVPVEDRTEPQQDTTTSKKKRQLIYGKGYFLLFSLQKMADSAFRTGAAELVHADPQLGVSRHSCCKACYCLALEIISVIFSTTGTKKRCAREVESEH